MVCQNCKVCEKDFDPDYICLYSDRDCYDDCDYCLDEYGEPVYGCKYE